MTQPGYPAQYPDNNEPLQQNQGSNTIAAWALGVAVVSLISILLIGSFALIPGLIAVVLGIVALVKAKKYAEPKAKRKGFAIGAIVIGTLVSIFGVITLVFLANIFGECADYDTPEEVQRCIEEKAGV